MQPVSVEVALGLAQVVAVLMLATAFGRTRRGALARVAVRQDDGTLKTVPKREADFPRALLLGLVPQYIAGATIVALVNRVVLGEDTPDWLLAVSSVGAVISTAWMVGALLAEISFHWRTED